MDPMHAALAAIKTAADSKLTGFIAGLLGGPVEEAIGIWQDRLKIARWERQNRLIDRCSEIVRRRGLEGRQTAVPPKFVGNILEAASLEDNDTLQDMWAELLVTASDPARRHMLRAAFIEIIRQLEPLDAQILDYAYERTLRTSKPQAIVYAKQVCETLKLDEALLRESLDNLMRLRLLISHVEKHEVVTGLTDDPDSPWTETVSYDNQYSEFHFTRFGLNFMRSSTSRDSTTTG